MTDGWGEAEGIKSNYEDGSKDEPGDDVESTQEPSPSASTEPETPSTPSTCQAETRGNTQCQNDAQENSEYCKKHSPNAAGELTWKFERVQLYMRGEDEDTLEQIRAGDDDEKSKSNTKKELFALKKRLEVESDSLDDVSKKAYSQTIMELITEDEAVQERLVERLNEKYGE